MSIVEEVPGYIQVFSDGSVVRFGPETAPPSADPSSGAPFISKDVAIDPTKPITARIFIPNPNSTENSPSLPVLVYFHGGGFCVGSTKWLGYHDFLGHLAATARAVVVSVDYRLAPEHRLPVAYDDCFQSLEWLSTQAATTAGSGEPWLRHADLSRVFLSGDSAGGNIAHNVAVRTIRGADAPRPVGIRGVLLIHPYFGSETRTGREEAEVAGVGAAETHFFWRMSLPVGANRDYYGCNFETAAEEVEWGRFPAAAVVYVAGQDALKVWGERYGEFLKGKGVKGVEVVEEEGEGHVYHLFHPQSEATRRLQRHMSDIINAS